LGSLSGWARVDSWVSELGLSAQQQRIMLLVHVFLCSFISLKIYSWISTKPGVDRVPRGKISPHVTLQ